MKTEGEGGGASKAQGVQAAHCARRRREVIVRIQESVWKICNCRWASGQESEPMFSFRIRRSWALFIATMGWVRLGGNFTRNFSAFFFFHLVFCRDAALDKTIKRHTRRVYAAAQNDFFL